MTDRQTHDARIGADLRSLRKMRGLTLSDLATKIGKSSGWLSQLERGKSRAEAADLPRLAAALRVPASLLMPEAPDTPQEAGVIVRADARRSYGHRLSGLTEEVVTPGLQEGLEVIHARFEPYSALVTPRRSKAEEHGYILSGRLLLTIAGTRHDLRRGDSFRICDQSYQWENPSGAITAALWIVTPSRY
jgi:transcriptional regulator with XRE-family HTH domain